jgi:hypothetical protein
MPDDDWAEIRPGVWVAPDAPGWAYRDLVGVAWRDTAAFRAPAGAVLGPPRRKRTDDQPTLFDATETTA